MSKKMIKYCDICENETEDEIYMEFGKYGTVKPCKSCLDVIVGTFKNLEWYERKLSGWDYTLIKSVYPRERLRESPWGNWRLTENQWGN